MSETHHTTLTDKARFAQDEIGWCDFSDHSAAARVVTDLARFVTTLARTVQQQTTVIDQLREQVAELELRVADTETRVNDLEAAATTDQQRGLA